MHTVQFSCTSWAIHDKHNTHTHVHRTVVSPGQVNVVTPEYKTPTGESWWRGNSRFSKAECSSKQRARHIEEWLCFVIYLFIQIFSTDQPSIASFDGISLITTEQKCSPTMWSRGTLCGVKFQAFLPIMLTWKVL